MRQLPRVVLPLALAAVACGGDGDPCPESTGPCAEGPFPELLSQFDATGAIPYEPRWVLWSNGLEKDRSIVLPSSGERIDISDRERWDVPEGTSLMKEFSVRGPDGVLRPVETRIIRRRGGTWETAVYIWNDDHSDAELVRTGGPVAVTVTDEEGRTFDHTVPGPSDCLACHGSSPGFLLGVRELQLNKDDQLQHLEDLGVFASSVPSDPDVVEAPDGETEWVMGYATANCVHCHNGVAEFDLSHDVFLDAVIGQPGSSGELLIAPGSPGNSLLFTRFQTREMPPLGVQIRDDDAVERLRLWILNLSDQEQAVGSER